MNSSTVLSEAADNVRSVLLAGPPARGPVRYPLAPGAADRLDAVTGGDATLRWTALAAAAAVVLRRLGCGDRCLLGTGEPPPQGARVLVETDAEVTFRDLLGRVRAAVLTDIASGAGGIRSLTAGSVTMTVGGEDVGGPGEDVVLTVRAGAVVGESARLDATLLTALVSGTAEVLRAGLSRPGTTVAELPILPGPAHEAVVNGFNRTRDVRGELAYRRLVLQQARERPDAPAVHDGRDEVGYAQLARAALLISARLRSAGVGRDDVVALIAPRDTWFVVAAVGILFSGAAYLPVEPSIPAARRHRLLAGVRALISAGDRSGDRSGEQPGDGPDTVLDLGELLAAARLADLDLDDDTVDGLLGEVPDPHDLAYVIYTSGSTGDPKGASLEHHSFLNFMRLRALDCEMRPGTELPQTAPVSFDISVWQMFAPLTVGATVCVLPDEVTQDPAAMAALIVDHGYEYVELVPTFIAVLLDQFRADPELAGRARSQLRGLISTGEVLGVDLARRWNSEMPGVPLDNAYGPAECTDDVTQGPVVPGPDDLYAPIGRPLPNTRLYVLDRDFQPLPPGVIGEIFVGGANVGRGYHRRPRLTAAAFLPDPYGAPGTRMYRTGDRGRWRADGVLECLGRADTQVKFRGRRIELGEIGVVLEAHPDVVLAAVELVRDEGLERLVGFAARRPGTDVRPEALLAHLSEQLPAFMVPHLLLVRDELPLNQNGKVDHLVLRRLAGEHVVAAGTYEPPRDDLERLLCTVLAEQLRVERVGRRDDFHDIGGDSIVSIRLTQALRAHGVVLRPRVVLQSGTVEAMAEAIRSVSDESGTPGAPAGVLPPDLAPLSAAQEDFFRSGTPEPHHWNSSVLFTLPQYRSLAQIEDAVGSLAGRHPALRSRFVPTGQGIRQGWSDAAPPVSEFVLAPDDAAGLDRQTHAHATALHRSLNLYDGPVCRVGVVRGPQQDRLVLIVHHAVLDMLSWDILATELSTLLRDGPAADLPAPTASFHDWTRRLAEEALREPERWAPGHWLGDWSAVPITDGDWGVQRDQVDFVTVLDAGSSTRFLESRRHRAPVGERLTAALGRAIQEWLGCPGGDVLVQLGGHGREDLFDDLDVSGTVGYFSTAYPFRLPLPGGHDDRTHLATVSDRLRAVPGHGRGFGLLRYGHPDRSVRAALDAVPTPSIMFDVLGEIRYVDAAAPGSGLDFLGTPTSANAGEARSPLTPRPALIEIRAGVVAGRVSVEWLFSAEKIAPGRVHDLADEFLAALRRQTEGEVQS
ncbi:amino acid adenylation domain-containing protein [Kineosporia succinea]|uniref:Amino acid adenylation domain-containing protein/non-ribosomal peptide synthase protein (TIGR01720 family) n=1 Tax=Kineosporia succinea TaxID=84632 RepID=A0ABT9PBX1_9ACTN|nr:amino acid adenylation domain-containing protein [Kineosporia succinea]MDP9830202.1 amino acid adenylation domain-containing protein/non-ribosomal peptide synthase protein (TIGR01720 family) [Kineosporia succinea]